MLKPAMQDVTGKISLLLSRSITIVCHHRCEVTFPRAPEAGSQESSYELRVEGNVSLVEQSKNERDNTSLLYFSDGSAGGYQYGSDQQQQQQQQQEGGYPPEVTAQPSEATVARGEKVNITCVVKGAQQYTVKWGKYAHDTALPDYARVCVPMLGIQAFECIWSSFSLATRK